MSGVLIGVVIGLGVGLFTGLWSWWIVARFVRPELLIVPEISKLPDDTGLARWRYRIKILNRRPRFLPHMPAVDLRVSAVLRIKGIRQSFPDSWYSIGIPVGRTGELAYIKWNSALRLRLHDISDDQTRLIPEEVRIAIKEGTIELETLLGLGSRAQLRVVVTASHSYTFGRTFALQRFGTNAIKPGPFDPLDPRVNFDLVGADDEAELSPDETEPEVLPGAAASESL